MIFANSLTELASKLDVPMTNLTQTVEEFNYRAERGEDPCFNRGRDAYDQYWGDASNPLPTPSLAPLHRGPFYAVEVVNGVAGTCGGPSTDSTGRVLDVDGSVIPGLLALGNTAESTFAAGYPGAGSTLGPAMALAYVAGREIATPSRPTGIPIPIGRRTLAGAEVE